MKTQVIHYIDKTKKDFFIMLMLNIINTFLAFLYIPFINSIERRLFYREEGLELSFVLLTIGFVIITVTFYFFSKEKTNKYYIDMNEKLKGDLGEYLWKIEPYELCQSGESKYLMLVTKIKSCSELVDSYLSIGISTGMLIVLSVYICVYMDLRYLLFVILMICIPIGTMILSKPIEKKQQEMNELEKQSLLLIKNMIRGLSIVKCYFLESKVTQKFKEKIHFLSKIEQNKKIYQSIVEIYMQIGRCLIMILIPTLTALLSRKMNLIQEGILSSSIIFFYLLGHMMEVAGRIGNLQEQKADMEFLEQFYSLDTLKELYTKPGDKILELKGENLGYAYGDKEVFKSYNMVLPSTGLILVKGESGKGKSTLLKCMSGLLQIATGKFYINNTEIEREELFQLCVYEPQDPVLCSDIKDNFRIVNNTLSDEEVFSFIKCFDPKLAKKMWENVGCEMLSRGEKKIIQVLRCTVSEANWLFLDEPFSALEQKVKDKIEKMILEIAKQKCVVIAMHETDMDEYADNIYILH
ncbi:ABC transporter ATP-binding protein [Drancourtella massiliensis]|uniref:ABC transporter ATP-binding protein n=1 Tax=Drancourtella massiliensis TaxID=1632013 RepID=A0ABS2EJG9_9FIRM|nr:MULTISPECIES: ABC transporter ATP-binding protein [Oscillospiraceae]MBM6745116.1 ABC transporter ATP-binding protein [Drancourtella massiliensis]